MANVRIPQQTVALPSLDPDTEVSQRPLTVFTVPLTDFRVHDAFQTVLPGTPANDDLGLIGTAFGTSSPTIEAGDLKAAGATTRYARCVTRLPYSYEAAKTVNVRVHAQMVTTVADSSCTIDVECYKSDEAGGIGSDLCTTAAQDMNSLTDADFDFTITATGLVAGDTLDIRLAIACNDGATGTAVTPQIGAVQLLADTRC